MQYNDRFQKSLVSARKFTDICQNTEACLHHNLTQEPSSQMTEENSFENREQDKETETTDLIL